VEDKQTMRISDRFRSYYFSQNCVSKFWKYAFW